jgi:hypothetical protein
MDPRYKKKNKTERRDKLQRIGAKCSLTRSDLLERSKLLHGGAGDSAKICYNQKIID